MAISLRRIPRWLVGESEGVVAGAEVWCQVNDGRGRVVGGREGEEKDPVKVEEDVGVRWRVLVGGCVPLWF